MRKNNKHKELPKIVFFDYGNTLCADKPFDGTAGYTAVLDVATSNPCNVDASEMLRLSDEVYGRLMRDVHPIGYEIPHQCINRLLFDTYGLKFDKSPVEMEDIYWSNALVPIPRPNIAEVLDGLAKLGIKTGVISTMSFSGEAMKKRLDRIMPNNLFECIVTSGDYGFRKPNKDIYIAAMGKMKMNAADCLYCGDSVEFDIIPASELGIKTVWYTGCMDGDVSSEGVPATYQVSDWCEFFPIIGQ